MSPEYYRAYLDRLKGPLLLEHPHFDRALRELTAHASLATPGTVLALIGPTRTGKSTVANEVISHLRRNIRPVDPDDKPVVRIEATNAQDGLFSMKHLTLRGLSEVEHPILGDLETGLLKTGYSPRVALSETHLRIALEKAFKHRRTVYLFIDEAGNLLVGRNKRRASEVLESLKSLGNSCELVVVFIGGYALLEFLQTSAHLCGRLCVIPFTEYFDTKEDNKHFAGILKSISESIPLEPGTTLLDHEQLLRDGSLGIYGLLVGWLSAAIRRMAANESQYLSVDDLNLTRLAGEITIIQEELDVGAEYLLRILRDDTESIPPQEPKKPSKKKAQPFSRRPKRDIVAT